MVFPGIDPNGMMNIQSLRLDQQYFLQTDQLANEIDLAPMFDMQFAVYAITQLGEYR